MSSYMFKHQGRVKEVKDNYTQNFTPPTTGYDCHISDQLGAVSSTTSSFLAYERTQVIKLSKIVFFLPSLVLNCKSNKVGLSCSIICMKSVMEAME